jgi:hypothetical protein
MTWRQVVCGVWPGHLFELHLVSGRWWLRCLYCGRETPGWPVP